MKRKNAWTTYNKKQLDELDKLCKNYLKFLDKGKTERECVKQIVKQAEEKYKIREISYLFQTLEKEWERSGRTVTKRKLNQDALDMFSEYYVQKVKEYETEQDNIKTKTIQKMVKEIKEMSILLRIVKKICAKSKTQTTENYIIIELDREERNCLEYIIGSED